MDQLEAPQLVTDEANELYDIFVVTPRGDRVKIPSVHSKENLGALVKQTLLEFIETATKTCYNFALEEEIGEEAGSKTLVLTDYTEVGTIAQQGSNSTKTINLKMVKDFYDVKKVRAHLKRVKEVIAVPVSLRGSTNEQVEEKKKAETSNTKALSLPSQEEIFSPLTLGAFYKNVLLRVGGADTGATKTRPPKLSDCICSICLSAWNPPPPTRQMQGDLLYIEVVSEHDGVFHITATCDGFFVNKSNRHTFDPSPATNPCFDNDLFSTLLEAITSFRVAWTDLTSRSESDAESRPLRALDYVAQFYGEGRGDQISQRAQWNVAPSPFEFSATAPEAPEAVAGAVVSASSKHPVHTSDMSRTHDFLCDSFGLEDKAAPRAWNEEIQSLRSYSPEDGMDKVTKAKFIFKTNTEFLEACKLGAVAVVEGHIASLNPMDPAPNHVFVYNDIFFSRAVDTKDSYKLCNGDDANRKAAGHDVKNQRVIQSLGIDGLCTGLTCVVDYKGQRVICQTMIPGVLMAGAGAARLMYGAIEFGKRFSCKKEAHEKMCLVGKKLHLPVRNVPAVPVPAVVQDASVVKPAAEEEAQQPSIRTDEDDEEVPTDSASIPHVGPIEGKVLKGADGRLYVLEVMRLTPRDCNYLESARGGTRLIEDALVEDKALGMAYVLRPELVSIFVEKKVDHLRSQLVKEISETFAPKSEEAEAAAPSVPSEDPSIAAVGGGPATGVSDSSEAVAAAGGGGAVESGRFTKEMTADLAERINSITAESTGFEISPNCFLTPSLSPAEAAPIVLRSDIDDTVAAKDEETARELATFLFKSMLPAVTHDVRMGNMIVNDSEELVSALHERGVNLRYLGELCRLAQQQEREDHSLIVVEKKQRTHQMPLYWLEMLEVEIIARGVKHVLNNMFGNDAAVRAAPALTVVSVLNHVFGQHSAPLTTSTPPSAGGGSSSLPNAVAAAAATSELRSAGASKASKKKKGKAKAVLAIEGRVPSAGAVNAAANRDTVLAALNDVISARFLYKLSLAFSAADASSAALASVPGADGFLKERLSKLMLLRRVSHVCGLRIASRDYNLSSANPFTVDDLLGLVPRVKSCTGAGTASEQPVIGESVSLLHAAHRYSQSGDVGNSFDMTQQAANLIQQVAGPVHRDLIGVYFQMASILFEYGDVPQAQVQWLKNLNVAIQLDGLDSAIVLQQHHKIAETFIALHALSQAKAGSAETPTDVPLQLTESCVEAANHLLVCKYLAELMGGPRHPEVANVLLRLGHLYGEVGQHAVGLRCLQEARFRVTDISRHCMISHMVAEMHMRVGNLHEGLVEQQNCLHMMQELFGKTDEKTVEAKNRFDRYLTILKAVEERKATEAKRAEVEARVKAARAKIEQDAAAAAESEALKQNSSNTKKGSKKGKK